MKQCAFYRDGEEAVAPLPQENLLGCKLLKGKEVKEAQVDGKSKTVKETVYSLEICNKSFACPQEVWEKILNGGKAGSMPLSVRFTPYDGACGEGFTAKVLRVLDYGDERFAEYSVTEKVPPVKKKKRSPFKKKSAEEKAAEAEVAANAVTEIERKIYVAVDKEFSGESVCISPDMNKVKVYSLEQDIRLV